MAGMGVRAVPDEPEGQEGPGVVTIATAVDKTIAAIGPPDADAAVVALARKMAMAIDDMKGEQLSLMIGQTAPQLLKVLQELEGRAQRRRASSRNTRPNAVSKLRAAHANSPAKRKRAT